jgi:NhaP-type Na+/H+ or K+/H+ antiporter
MEGAPTPEVGFDSDAVTRVFYDALFNTAVDFWYIWLGMLALGVVLVWLNAWTRRFEARRRGR